MCRCNYHKYGVCRVHVVVCGKKKRSYVRHGVLLRLNFKIVYSVCIWMRVYVRSSRGISVCYIYQWCEAWWRASLSLSLSLSLRHTHTVSFYSCLHKPSMHTRMHTYTQAHSYTKLFPRERLASSQSAECKVVEFPTWRGQANKNISLWSSSLTTAVFGGFSRKCIQIIYNIVLEMGMSSKYKLT